MSIMSHSNTNHCSAADWNDRYAIGIPEVDSHYLHLFFLFNTNSDGFIDYAAAKDDLRAIFVQLIDYARFQFFAEERWMRAHLYPRVVDHEEEHADRLIRISGLYKEICGGKWPLSLDILEVMHLWLKDHVLLSNEEIDDFAAYRRQHHSPRSCEFKKKTVDSTQKILLAWHDYCQRPVIDIASPIPPIN